MLEEKTCEVYFTMALIFKKTPPEKNTETQLTSHKLKVFIVLSQQKMQ